MEELTVTADDGVALHVGLSGSGTDILVLSGGPGCVMYLEDDRLTPSGHRAWYAEPRGVGRSGGGPHSMAEAVADLEAIRRTAGAARRGGASGVIPGAATWRCATPSTIRSPSKESSASRDTVCTEIAPGRRRTRRAPRRPRVWTSPGYPR